MLKPRGKTDLPEKPVTAEAQGEFGVQRLERDRTIVPRSRARYTVAIPPRPSSRSMV